MSSFATLRGRARALPSFEQRIQALERRVAVAQPLHGQWIQLESFDADAAGRVIGYRDAEPTARDGVYLGFEQAFRGTDEFVRERQRAYVPLLGEHAPVLDVGCGRGELLELLREAAIPARGIDADPAMVDLCHVKDLTEVQQAEALTYLQALPDRSLGAVVASHLVEHFGYDDLLVFLRTSASALRPGGLLVMTTPNPHSPQALKHFWIDPTHHHPLFPEVLLVLCRLVGFPTAYIWYATGGGEPERDALEQLEYSVVAEAGASHMPPAPVPGATLVHTDAGELLHPRDEVLAAGDRTDIAEIEALIEPGMTIVEVGAHVGYRTLAASRLVGAGGRVLALEPEHAAFTLLFANVARAGTTNVSVTHAAAAAAPGLIELPGAPAGASRVPALRLDDLLLSQERVDLVLIDAPGTERAVLDGLRDTIARCSPAIRDLNGRAASFQGVDP